MPFLNGCSGSLLGWGQGDMEMMIELLSRKKKKQTSLAPSLEKAHMHHASILMCPCGYTRAAPKETTIYTSTLRFPGETTEESCEPLPTLDSSSKPTTQPVLRKVQPSFALRGSRKKEDKSQSTQRNKPIPRIRGGEDLKAEQRRWRQMKTYRPAAYTRAMLGVEEGERITDYYYKQIDLSWGEVFAGDQADRWRESYE